jgi:hypothetical protein
VPHPGNTRWKRFQQPALTVESSSRGPAGVRRPRDDSIASNEPLKMALSHVRVLEESVVVLQIQSKERCNFPRVCRRGATML